MKSHGIVIVLAVALAALPVASGGDDPMIVGVPAEIVVQAATPAPITLELKDAEVRDAIAMIAKFAGKNIIVDGKVKGKITLSLKDIPWRDALTHVAKIAGAVVVTDKDGTLRIGTKLPTASLADSAAVALGTLGAFKSPVSYTKWPGIAGRVLGPDGKPIPRAKLATYITLTHAFGLATAVTNEKLLKDLRAAIKSLRAAGLEKEAKSAEKELKRREAAKFSWTAIGGQRLEITINALRADVAALREEVRALTALVKKMATEK